MSRRLVKRWMPDHKKIKELKSLRVFGSLIHDPNLWHLNRHSVAKAFTVGMLWAWVPIPFQMVCAAATAILIRSNFPISVALVWVTNPVTMPVLYYFAYRVGLFILGAPLQKFTFELSWEWLVTGLLNIWQPFLLGCAICGIVCAIAANIVIRLLWKFSVSRQWQARKRRQFLLKMRKKNSAKS